MTDQSMYLVGYSASNFAGSSNAEQGSWTAEASKSPAASLFPMRRTPTRQEHNASGCSNAATLDAQLGRFTHVQHNFRAATLGCLFTISLDGGPGVLAIRVDRRTNALLRGDGRSLLGGAARVCRRLDRAGNAVGAEHARLQRTRYRGRGSHGQGAVP